MPEHIRFVLEAPHVNRTQKKRPRLVTSCDNWYFCFIRAHWVRADKHFPFRQPYEED